MRNVLVILGVLAAGVGLSVGLVRGPGAARAARGQSGAGGPPFLATQSGGTALLAPAGYEYAGVPALPGSDAAESAVLAQEAQPGPVAQPAGDDKPPTELVADIDGDGSPDRVWVSKESGQALTDRRAYVEAEVGGTHVRVGPYEALGLKSPSQLGQLPPELEELQILPKTPLGLADVNLDGTPELVVRFGVPRSGGFTFTVILAWDAEQETLREIGSADTRALLCMDATGRGQGGMFSFEMVLKDVATGPVPVVRSVDVWNGQRYVTAANAVPPRLARALMPVYERAGSDLGLFAGPSIMEGYAAAAIGAGRPFDAVNRITQAIQETAQVEEEAGLARRRMLVAMGTAQIAAGDERGAIESFQAAGDIGTDPNRPPEVTVALRLALAYAAAGDREKAVRWVDEAERRAGTPGAFAHAREYYANAPNLLAMDGAPPPAPQ
jgi:hypothetical protein